MAPVYGIHLTTWMPAFLAFPADSLWTTPNCIQITGTPISIAWSTTGVTFVGLRNRLAISKGKGISLRVLKKGRPSISFCPGSPGQFHNLAPQGSVLLCGRPLTLWEIDPQWQFSCRSEEYFLSFLKVGSNLVARTLYPESWILATASSLSFKDFFDFVRLFLDLNRLFHSRNLFQDLIYYLGL